MSITDAVSINRRNEVAIFIKGLSKQPLSTSLNEDALSIQRDVLSCSQHRLPPRAAALVSESSRILVCGVSAEGTLNSEYMMPVRLSRG
ncbi:hypothetical protein SAMN05428964_103397 [Thalassospira xiamenensis]|uniref:Uncharacterized protein n=1 Tax=Thalassospira xiamenensis TaxID=220697 RepID=A0A285TGT7_9PROT|nr:hypothetical protein SAMN05428964_103397 [Thalassospira xiamenensis]